MAAEVDYSATAPIYNASDVSMDTIKVSPAMYAKLSPKPKLDANGDPVLLTRVNENGVEEAIMNGTQVLYATDDLALIWRDPALHAGSTFSMKMEVVEGASGIGINPLIVTPMGGDFDGDTIAIYLPHTKSAQSELAEKLSVNAYLKDSVQPDELKRKTVSSYELNDGMDAAAAVETALNAGVAPELAKIVETLEETGDDGTLKTGKDVAKWANKAWIKYVEKVSAEYNNPVAQISKVWNKIQETNIGGNHLDLSDRESLGKSVSHMAEIGSKGDAGKVDAALQYADKTKRDLGSHIKDGAAIEANGTKLAMADLDIHEAMALQQDLTAQAGQAAINLNQLFVDYDFKSPMYADIVNKYAKNKADAEFEKMRNNEPMREDLKLILYNEDGSFKSTDKLLNHAKLENYFAEALKKRSPAAIITETTEQVTQTALQVKHDPTDALWVEDYLTSLNRLVKQAKDGTTHERLDVDGWKQAFKTLTEEKAHGAVATSEDSLEAMSLMFAYDKQTGLVQEKVKTQDELKEQSSAMQILGYGGFDELKSIADNQAPLTEGVASHVMLEAFNKKGHVSYGTVETQAKAIERARVQTQQALKSISIGQKQVGIKQQVNQLETDFVAAKMGQAVAANDFIEARKRGITVDLATFNENDLHQQDVIAAAKSAAAKIKMGGVDERATNAIRLANNKYLQEPSGLDKMNESAYQPVNMDVEAVDNFKQAIVLGNKAKLEFERQVAPLQPATRVTKTAEQPVMTKRVVVKQAEVEMEM